MRSSSPRRLCVEKPDCQGFQHAARKTRRRVLNLTPGISDNPCKVENQGEGAAGQTCNGCGGADRAETLLEVQFREGAGEPEAGCGTRGVNCTARNLRYGRIRNTDQKNRKPRRILCRNAQDSSGFFDRCIRLQGAPQIRYPGPDGGRWIWSRIRGRRCGR